VLGTRGPSEYLRMTITGPFGAVVLSWVLWLCLLSVAAIRFPPDSSNSSPRQLKRPKAKPAPVILIRGWRDLWSDGIDRLAERLKSEGVETAVFKDAQAKEVGAALTARAAEGSLNGAVILIGFSYGADDVIEIATKLSAANRPVDLLVLIDPVTPSPIPTGVRRCVNYYQPNGVWDMFPWLRGVPVKPAPSGNSGVTETIENIDIRSREDLAEPGTSHKTIAGNTKVHAAIVAKVRTVLRTAVPPVPSPGSLSPSR
jgi:hypothetical protein